MSFKILIKWWSAHDPGINDFYLQLQLLVLLTSHSMVHTLEQSTGRLIPVLELPSYPLRMIMMLLGGPDHGALGTARYKHRNAGSH